MIVPQECLQRSPLIVELGCGAVKRNTEAVGVDILDLPGVDIVGDALEVLRSLPDSCVYSIYSEHFMEHLPNPHEILKEAARVLRDGGEFRAIVPHFSNPWYYSDPTHRSFFGLYTFSYWVSKTPFRRLVPHYEELLPFELISARHVFKSSKPFYVRHGLKKMLASWVNLGRWTQEFYEENLTPLLPCYEVDFILEREVSNVVAGMEN